MSTVSKDLQDLMHEMQEAEKTTRYNGFTVANLRETFSAITNPADWRAPIAVLVPGDLGPVTVAAIRYFPATQADVGLDPRTMQSLVPSIGYRQGPAGDH